MDYQYQWNVSAVGQGRYDVARCEIFPEDDERKAKDCYHDFLVKYPFAQVWIEKESRKIGTRYGIFLIARDGSMAVNETDPEMRFTLPTTTMSDNSIRKFIYSQIEK